MESPRGPSEGPWLTVTNPKAGSDATVCQLVCQRADLSSNQDRKLRGLLRKIWRAAFSRVGTSSAAYSLDSTACVVLRSCVWSTDLLALAARRLASLVPGREIVGETLKSPSLSPPLPTSC